MALIGEQLGRYHLLSILGSGGMGEVYLAEDTHIHRQVAVKVVRNEASPYPSNETAKESERLFRREVRAIATLDHPHILPLFDYGEQTLHNVPYTYMVMPLRQEGSLASWLQQHTGTSLLAPQSVLHFTNQAASALSYAHRRQIIHQDVKPSNFLMRTDEERPELPDIQLADFGIAKFYTSTASLSQTSRGTPTYMAPEQWSGQPVPATDQYALAVMTYQLLTGNPPFQGRQEQMMYQHFQVQPKPPGAGNPALPVEIDAVLLRALAKKPEERYPHVSAFAQALREALGSNEAPTIAQLSGAIPRLTTPSSPAIPPTPPSRSLAPLRTTLAISANEARSGATRTLTLPGGRKVQVHVPASVSSGHAIYLEQTGSLNDGSPGEPLLVTVEIRHTDEERASLAQSTTHTEETYLSDPGKGSGTIPAPVIPTNSQRRPSNPFWPLTRRRAILWIGLIVLIILASVGLPFYFNSYNYLQRMSLLNASSPNPYPPHSGTLALNDPLINNSNGYFWYEGSDTSGACGFTGGAYHVVVHEGNNRYCGPDPVFSNFVFETQMTIVKGDCGGLAFRADYINHAGYFFQLCTDGSYTIRTDQTSIYDSILTSDQPLTISDGQTITLAVVAQNTNFTIYVNSQQVKSIQDASYSSGHIDSYALAHSQTTNVAFNNARVWTLP